MKSFILSLVAAFMALIMTQSLQAAPKVNSPKGQLSEVEVDGKKVTSIRLVENGANDVITLPSGHKVTVETKNGQAVSAKALTKSGTTLNTSIRNSVEAAKRVIIIIIRDGGTVIVIIIRTKVA